MPDRAVHGDEAVCRRCKRSITLAGELWLDSDGVSRCEAGHVHSATGTSAMPARLGNGSVGPEKEGKHG